MYGLVPAILSRLNKDLMVRPVASPAEAALSLADFS
jgi:hypothetical protein